MNSAIVHTLFKGCDDGQVHPRQIAKGETVYGDLARAAVAGGFAEPACGPHTGEATLGDAAPQINAAPANKARKAAPAKK